MFQLATVLTSISFLFRHQVQLNELSEEHQVELQRVHDLLQRERNRAKEDRAHFEKEAEQVCN